MQNNFIGAEAALWRMCFACMVVGTNPRVRVGVGKMISSIIYPQLRLFSPEKKKGCVSRAGD
jgi:hypothetical protein